MRYLLVLLFLIPSVSFSEDFMNKYEGTFRQYEADKYREQQNMYMQDIARSQRDQTQMMRDAEMRRMADSRAETERMIHEMQTSPKFAKFRELMQKRD
jgi:hypothetical protein